jgi:membrane protein YqaA with SNARE-associated domain
MPEKRKELFRYFSGNILRGIVAFVALLLVLLTFKNIVNEHYETWIRPVADQPFIVFSFFFLNEVTFGFLPPEIFMFLYLKDSAWVYWKWVTVMTVLSYIGGAGAFYIGRYLGTKGHLERWRANPRYGKFIEYYDKFDGILIIIAATTPVPFPLISMISGALGHTFWHYAKYAFTTRFIRFYLYAYVLWETGKIDFSALFR